MSTLDEQLKNKQIEKLEEEIKALKEKQPLLDLVPGISAVVTVLGFCFAIYQFVNQQAASEKARTDALLEASAKITREKIAGELSKFYYPVQMRLRVDDAMWSRIKNMGDKDLLAKIENNLLLPNKDEILSIILSNPGVLKDDLQLRDEVYKFIKHATIQKALRQTKNNDRDAVSEDEGWPKQFEPIIANRIKVLQDKYDLCLLDAKTCNYP